MSNKLIFNTTINRLFNKGYFTGFDLEEILFRYKKWFDKFINIIDTKNKEELLIALVYNKSKENILWFEHKTNIKITSYSNKKIRNIINEFCGDCNEF